MATLISEAVPWMCCISPDFLAGALAVSSLGGAGFSLRALAAGGRTPANDAWERLTPGRRRGWPLHFDGAKQSKTRFAVAT